MDRLIYIAMSGASQLMKAQTVNNNNLANLNTAGFRADMESIRALPVYGPGYPSRVYAQDDGAGVKLGEGETITTGRSLDVAIAGKGFIAVQAKNGTEAYTRAGNLKLTDSGQLLTADGNPVLGNSGPIAIPPSEKIDIGEDGTISVLPVGQEASTLAVVDRIKLVNPPADQLMKNEHGLLRLKKPARVAADASVRLSSGKLESSNVSAIGSMVHMIELSRQYEMQVNVMRTSKDNDAAAAAIIAP